MFKVLANVICLCDAPMCDGAVAASRVYFDVGGGFPEPRYQVGDESPKLREIEKAVIWEGAEIVT